MISDRRIAALAAVFGMLFVSACGGGGGGGGGGSTPIESNEELVERIRSDPRVVRLSEVAADANTLLVSSIYAPFSVTVLDENGAPVQQNDELVQGFECTGNSCVNVNSQIPYAVENFVPLNADIELTETNLGPQGGFDTLTTGGRFDLSSDNLSGPGLSITNSSFSGIGYGFWSEYGFAVVEIGNGTMSGEVVPDQAEPVSFTGELSWALAYVFGEASGTNPTGIGSATWNGIAEAASTDTFERRSGTATVTIADLSRPRVGVAIDIAGSPIGSAAWSDMPLTYGGFASGTPGTDGLEGNFHGPDHSETYGTFDTDTYVGAFGAKRAP